MEGVRYRPSIGIAGLPDIFAKDRRSLFLRDLQTDRKDLNKDYTFVNLFPGRKKSQCYNKLLGMIIKVRREVPESEQNDIILKYEGLGFQSKAVNALMKVDVSFNIIISDGAECVGHLCCCFLTEHWFLVPLMAVFPKYQRLGVGSLLLVLAEDLMNTYKASSECHLLTVFRFTRVFLQANKITRVPRSPESQK
jgi:GNAT superfamily N-acetyltransferase